MRRQEGCFVATTDMKEYKNNSAARSANLRFKEYGFQTWKDIINVFAMRVSCLFESADTIEYEHYSETISLYEVYEYEKKTQEEGVFVLSAFPEFLIDYFGMKLWRTCVKHRKNKRESC